MMAVEMAEKTENEWGCWMADLTVKTRVLKVGGQRVAMKVYGRAAC